MTNVADLETPALVIDPEKMERNLRRAATYTGEHHLRFRPTPTLTEFRFLFQVVGRKRSSVGRASEDQTPQ